MCEGGEMRESGGDTSDGVAGRGGSSSTALPLQTPLSVSSPPPDGCVLKPLLATGMTGRLSPALSLTDLLVLVPTSFFCEPPSFLPLLTTTVCLPVELFTGGCRGDMLGSPVPSRVFSIAGDFCRERVQLYSETTALQIRDTLGCPTSV